VPPPAPQAVVVADSLPAVGVPLLALQVAVYVEALSAVVLYLPALPAAAVAEALPAVGVILQALQTDVVADALPVVGVPLPSHVLAQVEPLGCCLDEYGRNCDPWTAAGMSAQNPCRGSMCTSTDVHTLGLRGPAPNLAGP
jgi:hypothetical protein